MESASLRFARTARIVTTAARAAGLHAPTFQSPPREAGLDRALRRRADSTCVAVRLRDRPPAAVLADMVEGVVAANGLGGAAAAACRRSLWAALASAGELGPVAVVPLRPSGNDTPPRQAVA